VAAVRKIELPEQKRQLLRLARDTAGEVLGLSDHKLTDVPHIEGRFGGAFVTLWAGRELRGCVGSFAATDDIASTIQEVTKQSLADARFVTDPITASQLKDIEIEISILSDLERTDDPASLTPGTHGIVVRRQERSGCYLPQVATDHGWNAKEFLANCCSMKAGLPADAWREQDTEVSLFTADVFSESGFSQPDRRKV